VVPDSVAISASSPSSHAAAPSRAMSTIGEARVSPCPPGGAMVR
jgi:hypothetical protein